MALATFPSQGGVERPAAVTLVPSSDWAAGIAASVLSGDPVRAPILLSDRDEVPEETATALEALRPEGSSETRDARVFRIGDATAPDNLRATDVSGGDPAVIAAEVDRLRAELVDRDPDNILASTEDPAFAMPAAAWAARSGDPVLFVERDNVPQATKEALKRHEDVPAYLLGPDSVASEKVVKEVEKLVPAVQRIEGENPAASLSSSRASTRARSAGTSPTPVTAWWSRTGPGLSTPPPPHSVGEREVGPMLVTENANVVPAPLRGFLLDIKPGYRTDPTRAFYNHAWLIGNSDALSVGFQAQLDDLLELVRIQPPPGAHERRRGKRVLQMSEAESPERLDPSHRVSVADIRALAGPVSTHFRAPGTQPHPAVDREASRRRPRPARGGADRPPRGLANYSGDPRGIGPIETRE